MLKKQIPLAQRFRATAPWALRHLFLSVLVGGLTAILVFGIWFPAPFRELSGGVALFALMLIVDVICGPVLSLLLLHPSKTRRALAVDIGLIALIQLSALGYGVYTLSHARPLAMVFEVDRFRVISYADIADGGSWELPAWVQPWGFLGDIRVLGVREPRSGEEKLKSIEASLQGVEPSQRPEWWQDYALSAKRVRERAKSLQVLQDMNRGQIHQIQTAAALAAKDPEAGETSSPNALLWLPLVSRQAMDWVVLLDPTTLRIRGYVHADGFGDS